MLVGEIDTKSSFKLEGKIGEPTNVELALAPGKATSTVPAPTAPMANSSSYVGTNRAAAGMATASTENNIYSAPMAAPSTINPYMQKQGEISSGANPSISHHQDMSHQDESFTPISALSPYQNTYICHF